MKSDYAKQILEESRGNYDAIAKDFSQTRQKTWEGLSFLFEDYIHEGDEVLDAGCGNGRFYPMVSGKKARYTGIDNSQNLIALAREKNPSGNFKTADVLNLPFNENFFDKIISIAVLHHIPSRQLRTLFFEEAKRVLKPGGFFILTVWRLDAASMILSFNFKRLSSFLREQILVFLKKSKLDYFDFFIPWRGSRRRYVHAYSVRELENLACASGLKVVKSGIVKRSKAKESNLFLVAQKNP